MSPLLNRLGKVRAACTTYSCKRGAATEKEEKNQGQKIAFHNIQINNFPKENIFQQQ